MALVYEDRVLETTTTTGTGALTLAGAVAGFRTFASQMAVADTCFYFIEAVNSSGVPTGDFETGLGTYSATNTLTRTTVLESSNAGAAVNLAAGTKRVGLSLPAFAGVFRDSAGGVLFRSIASAATPPTDTAVLVPQRIGAGGGRLLPRWRNEDGTFKTEQAHVGRNSVMYATSQGNSTNVPSAIGGTNLSVVGTATARTVAATNRLTRARRTGYVNASATAGLTAGLHNAAAHTLFSVGSGSILTGGGFLAVFIFGVSDASMVAGAHAFVGMRNSTAAPAAATSPATLTNQVGIAQVNGSTNWQMVYGGTAAQTAIDLGASFPVNNTDLMELILYARPDQNNKVGYRVENISTGAAAEGVLTGTAGTALPSSSTFLGPAMFRTNNATAAVAAIDVARYYIESDI